MLSLRTRLVLGHGALVFLILVAVSTGVVALEHVDQALDRVPPDAGESQEVREAVHQIYTVSTWVFAAIVILSLALLLNTWRLVHLTLAQRVGDLVEVARARSRGDRLRRVAAVSGGELAQVATFINATLDELDQLDAMARGRRAEILRLLEGLLGQQASGGAVIALDGRIVASTLGPEEQPQLESLYAEVREASHAVCTNATKKTTTIRLPQSDAFVRLRLLSTFQAPAVGWLATFQTRPVSAAHEGSGAESLPAATQRVAQKPRSTS